VSKKRALKDIQKDREYAHALIESELDTLRHPLRDPFQTVMLIRSAHEHARRLHRDLEPGKEEER
jgi:hypothetical protein